MDEYEFKIQSLMEKGYTREQAEERIIREQQLAAENLARSRSHNFIGGHESVASTNRSIILVDEGVPRYMVQSHTRNPSSMNSYSAYNQHQNSLDMVTVATPHDAHSTTSNPNSQIAIGPEQLSLVMSKGYTREQASMMSQREIRNILSERSSVVGHRSSASAASWEMPMVPANIGINDWSATSTYPGYHTRARTAGAHYFADPLPMPPHIQPQPPQPLFYTSSSSSNDFMEPQRSQRHLNASLSGSGSGGAGGSSSSVFYDGNSHSSSVSSDYLHRQGMMLQPANSSDSTVYTGFHRRVANYVPSLSGSGSYSSVDHLRRTQMDNELDGNEAVGTDVVISMGEPPIAYPATGGHPEVYEQLDGEEEEEEQEDEIQVLMETGYTRDQAIEFLRRNRPPSPGRSLFVVEGIQQQPPSGQVVVQPSSAIPLRGADFDPAIYQRANTSVSELVGVYFGDNSWDCGCDSKRWCCFGSQRCLGLVICWVFILLAGIIIGVLFLYPRDVVFSSDSIKYNIVNNNPSKSSIVQTYRIANTNWYSISASNFQFSMTASPVQPGSSPISFTASGVSSPPSSSIASQSDMVLTVTYSFNFVTKDQLQLARSVYSCNYTYSVSGAYSISDWQMSKSNSVPQAPVSIPCNITRNNPAPTVAPSSRSPVPLPSAVPTRSPSFRITAPPVTASPTKFLTSSPSSTLPSSLSTT